MAATLWVGVTAACTDKDTDGEGDDAGTDSSASEDDGTTDNGGSDGTTGDGGTNDGGTSGGGTDGSDTGTSGGGHDQPPTDSDFEWEDVETLDCGARGHAVLDSGIGENRVNFVILGDGYTADELDDVYVSHVNRMLAEMYGEELGLPHYLYPSFFNICRIDVVSNESGVDIPDEGVEVDTAMDGWGSDDTRLGLIDLDKFQAELDDAMSTANIEPDWAAVTLNTDRWFNSGGYPMIWSGGTSPVDVALHEGGHTFHGLADEYGGDPGPYTGGEPAEPNVTADSAGTKWSEWLGYDQDQIGEIGTYEGGRYYDTGIWRPSGNSKMNLVPARHNAPSVQKVILDIYTLVRPIDDFAPKTSGDLPPALGLRIVDEDMLEVDWEVDGELVLEGAGPRIWTDELELSPGSHEVAARVYDPTPWVRSDHSSLEQRVVWQVETPEGSRTTRARGARRAGPRVRSSDQPRTNESVPPSRVGRSGAFRPHPASLERARITKANTMLLRACEKILGGRPAEAEAILAAHADQFGPSHAADRETLEAAARCVREPSARSTATARALLASHGLARFRKQLRRACDLVAMDTSIHHVR